ncbi:MAG: extracellular solute-binding protein [Deltaproteobacteria bacterium]|nr:extracellular solute-binding protein [Deltaproteobacteria bacterium]
MRAVLLALLSCACGQQDVVVDGGVTLIIAASDLGAEGEALRALVRQFEQANDGVTVVLRGTPDGADERHQLFVQWLNAGAPEPDVLQIDVVWAAELASAGFLRPIDLGQSFGADLFPGVRKAVTWRETAWAAPWFVDVGMLYRRKDLVPSAPSTFDELALAANAPGPSPGFVWQGNRYEGLSCVFLEVLGGMGGAIFDEEGRVVVDSAAGVRALTAMASWVGTISPVDVVTMQEEQARFAFQNGNARFMRNWPYAAALFDASAGSDGVAGRWAVSPMPTDRALGRPTAALGGGALAINARAAHPEQAAALVAFLTSPAALLTRAKMAGQYPPRPSLYDADGALDDALTIDVDDARRIIEGATPRPVTPLYTELSSILQVHLHRSLTGQSDPNAALHAAAEQMRGLIEERGAGAGSSSSSSAPMSPPPVRALLVLLAIAVVVFAAVVLRRRGPEREEERLAWALSLPALVVMALCAAVPLALTAWESLHDRDLRLPWRGAPFVGLHGYVDVVTGERFVSALGHTLFFTAATVTLEVVLGLALALALHRAFFGRGLVRSSVLVPWAMPTVVAGVLWRFLFEGPVLSDPVLAWIPLVVADVWKTTPFVALLLLAGLAGIDESIDEAARLDGASAWMRLTRITLPLLAPALLVAVVFRSLDAVRVFDLVVVLTGGGPGTATEPLTLLTFDAFLRKLRFGEGAALSMIVFAMTMSLATLFVRLTRGSRT